jgi:probable addiction module antidote protein
VPIRVSGVSLWRFFQMSKRSDYTHPAILAKKFSMALNRGETTFLLTLMDAIKAQGISAVARKTGISRYTLHRYAKGDDRPLFTTVIKLTAACGVKVAFVPEARASD